MTGVGGAARRRLPGVKEVRGSRSLRVAQPAGEQASFLGGVRAAAFDGDDAEGAPLPSPAPAEEWRRVFWLMSMLRTSMSRGGFLSSDGRVYVPKRVWLQKVKSTSDAHPKRVAIRGR